MADFLKYVESLSSTSSSVQPGVTNIPQPPPLSQSGTDKKSNVCYVVREKIYPVILTDELLKLGFQLDSDVYQYEINGGVSSTPVLNNRSRYIVNDSFDTAESINAYLRRWGKIPSFLEVRNVANKGYGIIATEDITRLTFLGFYQGQYRPNNTIHSNLYGFTFKDFDTQPKGYIDAENITFANWTRFINDGENHNIEYAVYNNQIYIFAMRDIKAGEELTGSYGGDYWEGCESKGIKKFP